MRLHMLPVVLMATLLVSSSASLSKPRSFVRDELVPAARQLTTCASISSQLSNDETFLYDYDYENSQYRPFRYGVEKHYVFDLEAKTETVSVNSFTVYPMHAGTIRIYARMEGKASGNLQSPLGWSLVVTDDLESSAVAHAQPNSPRYNPARAGDLAGFNGLNVSFPQPLVIGAGQAVGFIIDYSRVLYDTTHDDVFPDTGGDFPTGNSDDFLEISKMLTRPGHDVFGRDSWNARNELQGFKVNYQAHGNNCDPCDLPACDSNADCTPADDGTYTCDCQTGLVGPGLGSQACYEDPCHTTGCPASFECSESFGEAVCQCPSNDPNPTYYDRVDSTCLPLESTDLDPLCSSEEDKFHICIQYSPPPDLPDGWTQLDLNNTINSLIAALLNAKNRWESILTRSVFPPVVHSEQGNAPSVEVPDLVIPNPVHGLFVYAQLIVEDGEFGFLAESDIIHRRKSSPDNTNPNPEDVRGLPYVGKLNLDVEDVARIDQDHLNDLVTQEIGKLLGFGRELWEDYGLVAVSNVERKNYRGEFYDPPRYQDIYHYTGAAACREFSVLYECDVCPPLEQQWGGCQYVGNSWDTRRYSPAYRAEPAFQQHRVGLKNEMMTRSVTRKCGESYSSCLRDQRTEENPYSVISRVTVGAMEDLGYTVDYSQAETNLIMDISADDLLNNCPTSGRMLRTGKEDLGRVLQEGEPQQTPEELAAAANANEILEEMARSLKCREDATSLPRVLHLDHQIAGEDIMTYDIDLCQVKCDVTDIHVGGCWYRAS